MACAGEGVQQAADTAADKAGGAVDSVKGFVAEAADTARASGEGQCGVTIGLAERAALGSV